VLQVITSVPMKASAVKMAYFIVFSKGWLEGQDSNLR
jgi:hypothetical protein